MGRSPPPVNTPRGASLLQFIIIPKASPSPCLPVAIVLFSAVVLRNGRMQPPTDVNLSLSSFLGFSNCLLHVLSRQRPLLPPLCFVCLRPCLNMSATRFGSIPLSPAATGHTVLPPRAVSPSAM